MDAKGGDLGSAPHGLASDENQPHRGPQDTSSISANSLGLSVSNSEDVDDDADSAIGDIYRPDSTSSMTSSVYKSVEEFGRTWHRYKQGKYFMPNDEIEQTRLDIQHAVSMKLFGKLYFAPLENPKRVLDLGTGTGIWATEFASMHPGAEVIGTDLSPIQPNYVPPNCTFEVDDIEDDWSFTDPFDYVHLRYMCASIRDAPRLIRTIYENLTPGGYLEFQDYAGQVTSIDGTADDSALVRWHGLLIDAVRKMGPDACQAPNYKRWMQEAGFVDVWEQRYAVPNNTWAKGRDKKELGMMQVANISGGLSGMTTKLFVTQLGMEVGEIDKLVENVKKDMLDKSIHSYWPAIVVLGRKPL
ncbi:Demethylmenaquinone methyltransferase [Pleurostoma richardsiae]|uniref:Demethylmenaquinone methyltransferase n=1 Tax=Pleurostoma richardsiae TaxID=41990 RepID=A0AA38VP20_9PEZI|nr:Demethylmenaquinone methyltransferase [Pleurostoma richardsiae]